MPPSTPFMEGFCLDVQKQISLKSAKSYLSENNKTHTKNTGFKGNFKYKGAACFTEYSL